MRLFDRNPFPSLLRATRRAEVVLMCDGDRLGDKETPESEDMEDGTQIEAKYV